MNVVIMAGGGGTRLWPLSRNQKPKQFLDLGSGATLIELAFARALKLTDDDRERIFVATAAEYQSYITTLLPDVSPDHVFLEPERRDTTAAFATIALRLKQRGYGDEPVIFLWSDHVFSDEAGFIRDVRNVGPLVREHPNALIVVGHVAVSAETTLGYIHVGEALPGRERVWRVQAFKEKPEQELADTYVADGAYFWNLGYFSLRPNYLLQELARHNPDLAHILRAYERALGSGEAAAIANAFRAFPKISIEYTFVEKTPTIIAITGDWGWSDVGNWAAVQQVFGKHGDHMPRGHHVHVDSRNNYIYNATDKAVSLVGLKNTIVVVTDDAVLVTNSRDSHKVKDVVARLIEDKQDRML